jgi:hypothetical protein
MLVPRYLARRAKRLPFAPLWCIVVQIQSGIAIGTFDRYRPQEPNSTSIRKPAR